MTTIFWPCAEVLIAAAQLGSERDLPSADRLRADLLTMLHRMVSQCRACGIPDAETAEARYATVAFIDERILKSSWSGRAEWMNNPLQMQLYREYTAGENFFARMRALLDRPQGSVALEVYYLCLALGFTGASASSAHARSYLDAFRARLSQSSSVDPICARALPRDRYAFSSARRSIVLRLALTCLVVVAFGLILLGRSMSATLRRSEGLLNVKAASSGAGLEEK